MPDLGASMVSAVLAELAGLFSQHRRTLRLTTVAGEDVLLAESLRGEEELSGGYRLQVSALSQDAGIVGGPEKRSVSGSSPSPWARQLRSSSPPALAAG